MRGNFCYHEIEKFGAVWNTIKRVMDINLTETEAGRHIEHHNPHGVTLADLMWWMVLLILSISISLGLLRYCRKHLSDAAAATIHYL